MLCALFPTPNDQRPRGGGSDFESLFGKFVRSDDGLWWAISGGSYSPWNLPSAWYGDDEAGDAFYGQFEDTPDGKHAVANGMVFRDAMRYLTDFWLEVYAFRERPEAIAIESWWAGTGLPIVAGVPRGAEHAFVNVDGAYWAALSSDESLLRDLAEKWPLTRFVPIAKADAR